MALGDITVYDAGGVGTPTAERFAVTASATLIYPGEPVGKALGAAVVAPLATNKPVAGTDFMAGIASSTSTNTASADGVVDVLVLQKGITYLCAPLTAATWDTQTEYDALVGDRVLFDLTSSTYTITATDGATNGLIVEPLNIAKFPGKVRFSIRQACDYRA